MPELQLFYGDANEAEARIYAALPREELSADSRLSGELLGPFCRYSHTLPAKIRFADRGPGKTLLAEAVVPDPCFWTPELPFLYRATFQIVDKSGGAATVANDRPFGIRRLGVDGTSIYLDTRRFVFRGVRRDTAEVNDLKEARSTAAVLYVSNPGDDFLREASEEGVLLAVDLTSERGDSLPRSVGGGDIADALSRLARFPAAAIVILNADVPFAKKLRLAARNTLLAQRATSVLPPSLAAWAHVAWWEIDDPHEHRSSPPNVPIVVYREARETTTIGEGRRACDRLQAELADLGDFAGYFV